jgi:hypothetical protein
VAPGGLGYAHDVVLHRLGDVDGADSRLALDYVHGLHHVGDVVEGVPVDLGAEDLLLGLAVGVADRHAHEEAVELRLRQRIGAVVVGGVLRGDHEERLGQDVRIPVDGDDRLGHALQKAGLRARGRAVDLVRQDDVAENGAGHEIDLGSLLVVDAHAGDVEGSMSGVNWMRL